MASEPVETERQTREPSQRPRGRYNLYLEDDLDEFLGELQLKRWRGKKFFSDIIKEFIRDEMDRRRST